MSYSLDAFRLNVRTHLDVDIEDIPDELLDQWAREATIYIARARDRWPFLEHVWIIGFSPDQAVYPFTLMTDPDVDKISGLQILEQQPLAWVGVDDFVTRSAATGQPRVYTVYEQALRVWPTPDTAALVAVRGYRQVRDWVSGGAGATSDLPVDFDDVIRNRLLGEAYSQQEDPEMGQLYFSKGEALLRTVEKRLGTFPQQQPMVMSGRASNTSVPQRIPFDFEV